jgi:hypothetical protein
MKKQLIAVLLVVFLGVGRLSAQEKDSIVTLPTVTVTTTTVVTKEVDKSFKNGFPAAQNLRWYKLDKDYLAKFIENDMKHQALFAKNGFLKYVISYGYQNHLPEDVLNKIKDAYDGYNITSVANVKSEDRNIWVANLENEDHLVIVRFEDEEMEEVGKYVKAD